MSLTKVAHSSDLIPVKCTGHLTDDERDALRLTAQLWITLERIVLHGPSRDQDLTELSNHLHGIQHAIMGQSAARVHPDLCRLLGAGPVPGDPTRVRGWDHA